MSERPFMQLYTGDLLASTIMLSAAELGAYVLLLVAAHENGGVLPPDERKLRRIAKLTPREFKATWAAIGCYFEEQDGFLFSIHLRAWALRDRLVGRRPLPASVREFVLRRDGRRCVYCGSHDGPFHIDHVIPVAMGGSDNPENLTVACQTCNLSKGKKTPEEWMT